MPDLRKTESKDRRPSSQAVPPGREAQTRRRLAEEDQRRLRRRTATLPGGPTRVDMRHTTQTARPLTAAERARVQHQAANAAALAAMSRASQAGNIQPGPTVGDVPVVMPGPEPTPPRSIGLPRSTQTMSRMEGPDLNATLQAFQAQRPAVDLTIDPATATALDQLSPEQIQLLSRLFAQGR